MLSSLPCYPVDPLMAPLRPHAHRRQPAATGDIPVTRAQFFKVFPVDPPADVPGRPWTRPSSPPRCRTSPARLGDVERISWVVVAYLMATTIAAPVYGRLGDVLGRKRLLFVALFVFIGASLACALAPTMLALIGGRASSKAPAAAG